MERLKSHEIYYFQRWIILFSSGKVREQKGIQHPQIPATKMKILTLYTGHCPLCKEKLRLSGPLFLISIAAPNQRGNEYMQFHTDCWNIASDSCLNDSFSYDDWTDLTGDEWDIWGLVETYRPTLGATTPHLLGRLYESRSITKKRFDELAAMDDS